MSVRTNKRGCNLTAKCLLFQQLWLCDSSINKTKTGTWQIACIIRSDSVFKNWDKEKFKVELRYLPTGYLDIRYKYSVFMSFLLNQYHKCQNNNCFSDVLNCFYAFKFVLPTVRIEFAPKMQKISYEFKAKHLII